MAGPVQLADEELNERVRFFTEFLDGEHDDIDYKSEIQKLITNNQRRLIVSIDHLRQYNRVYTENIIKFPNDYLPAFDKALKDVTLTLYDQAKRPEIEEQQFYVGFRGSFGDNYVNPRTLRAAFLGKMVCLEGIVTKCSLVRPKVIRSVHYCEATQLFYQRKYHDATTSGSSAPSTGSVYPTQDENGNRLTTEFGYCLYRDHQTVSIQEMPERAPAGQLPRGIDVILDDDLVDRVKPGDRIQLVGTYRSLGNRNASQTNSTFRTIILANNITPLSKGIASPLISDADIRNIVKISRRKNVFELLSRSLAPSIWGHDYIKSAVLLMLLGGMEKNLTNGTHIRGDINILMVGDPSTAKSQILRFVLNIAPLAIATTGRGSSGVGLTAAVTTDKETGERRLEAGAMVLADRGVVCIDEFDKMSEVDRVAIHEVMEQQTVTIAKAGIHTSLNARCSVIAAANPVYGQYDNTKDPHKNIALPDSLLSRFDLLFVVNDDIDDARDRHISEHVLRMHQYVPPGLEEGAPVDDLTMSLANLDVNDADEEVRETPVFERFNRLLHVGVTNGKGKDKGKEELLSIGFLKKYIHYAKNRFKPILTSEASQEIVKEYTSLRNGDDEENQRKTLPVTARTLETLIRLSTAHAKSRLSPRVEKRDTEAAVWILRYAMFKEVMPKESRKKRRLNPEGNAGESNSDEEESEEDEDEDEEQNGTRSRRGRHVAVFVRTTPRRASRSNGAGNSRIHVDDDEEDAPLRRNRRSSGAAGPSSELPSSSQVSMGGMAHLMDTDESQEISPNRLKLFSERLNRLIITSQFGDGSSSPLADVLAKVNQGLPDQQLFTITEAEAALLNMSSRNQIMYSERVVYIV